MKLSVSFIISFLLGFHCSAQFSHMDFPSIQEVQKAVTESLGIPHHQADSTIKKFEKRKQGWFIVKYNYYLHEIVDSQLIWNVKTGAYVDYSVLDDSFKKDPVGFQFPRLTEGTIRDFNNYPFYGYKGWQEDALPIMENAWFKSDSNYYFLGRAYMSLCFDMIAPRANPNDYREGFNLKPGRNSLSESQLLEYNNAFFKSMEYLEMVKIKNTDFECIVGNIEVKMSNDYMASFLDLRIKQNDKEAYKKLKPDLYNEFWMENARNFLRCCEPNAILFTHGDNDTYPLLYVQAFESFRTDVTVINTSYLHTADYINLFTEDYLNQKPIEFSYSKEQILGWDIPDVVYVMDWESSLELSELIQSIEFYDDSILKWDPLSKKQYHASLSRNQKESLQNRYIVPANKFSFWINEKEIFIKPKKRQILRNELIIYDVILNNFEDRPICFTNSGGSEGYFGLEDFVRRDVYVSTLTFRNDKHTNYLDGYVDPKMASSLLFDSCQHIVKTGYRPNEMRMMNQIQFVALNISNEFIAQSDSASSLLVLDKFLALYPNEKYPYGPIHYFWAEEYFGLNQPEKATEVLHKILWNLDHTSDQYSPFKPYQVLNYKQLIKRLLEKNNREAWFEYYKDSWNKD